MQPLNNINFFMFHYSCHIRVVEPDRTRVRAAAQKANQFNYPPPPACTWHPMHITCLGRRHTIYRRPKNAPAVRQLSLIFFFVVSNTQSGWGEDNATKKTRSMDLLSLIMLNWRKSGFRFRDFCLEVLPFFFCFFFTTKKFFSKFYRFQKLINTLKMKVD